MVERGRRRAAPQRRVRWPPLFERPLQRLCRIGANERGDAAREDRYRERRFCAVRQRDFVAGADEIDAILFEIREARADRDPLDRRDGSDKSRFNASATLLHNATE